MDYYSRVYLDSLIDMHDNLKHFKQTSLFRNINSINMFNKRPTNKINLRLSKFDTLYVFASISWAENLFETTNEIRLNFENEENKKSNSYNKTREYAKWILVKHLDISVFDRPGTMIYMYFNKKSKSPKELLLELDKQISKQQDFIYNINLNKSDFYDLTKYSLFFSKSLENWPSETVKKISNLPLSKYMKMKFIIAEYIVKNNAYLEYKN